LNGAALQVKICGITSIDDALLCAEYGADALGFIFYEKSKRFVSIGQTAKIINQLPPFIAKVGVFVDDSFDTINKTVKEAGLNCIQLHGNESSEFAQNFSLPVIKAFRVNNHFDWNKIVDYENCKILLDAFSQNEMGGTGKSFDWKSIPDDIKNKIILSGGISIDNLEFVFNEIKPAAVDLSSSLESAPGIKDHQKVKDFLNKLNQFRSNKC
jgi:phosphoribosylanthranilate isomerase